MSKPVWNTTKKVLGNLIPALIAIPFGILAVASFRPETGVSGKTLILLIAFPLVGWIAMNLFGLWGNGSMRAAIAKQLDRLRPGVKQERWFVGATTPGFRNALDPHEDVGFLIIHDDQLEFYGDTIKMVIQKSAIQFIRKKANAHSYVFAGGWINISANSIILYIEPRESPILFLNIFVKKRLLSRLEKWIV